MTILYDFIGNTVHILYRFFYQTLQYISNIPVCIGCYFVIYCVYKKVIRYSVYLLNQNNPVNSIDL